MAMATLWGVFGAIWILFAVDELGLGPAAIGIIAGFGGLSSLVGATIAERVTRRLGVGRAAIASMLVAASASCSSPSRLPPCRCSRSASSSASS